MASQVSLASLTNDEVRFVIFILPDGMRVFDWCRTNASGSQLKGLLKKLLCIENRDNYKYISKPESYSLIYQKNNQEMKNSQVLINLGDVHHYIFEVQRKQEK